MSESGRELAHVVAGSFEERVADALQDGDLRANVRVATDRFHLIRPVRLAEDLQDMDAWKQAARAIKEHTVAHLDGYLEQAATSIRRGGGQVHFAVDSDEARRIILDIARRIDARLVVKSKSMASEEVHLNQALAAAGITPVETDLGEYLIQLAGRTPIHLIAPAFHMGLAEIVRLLEKEAGHPLPHDPPQLTAFARRQLRDRFLRADIGISGGNFVVADTGTLCLVTNEGNARMVTSLPRVHIALVGIEKLVPTMADLGVMLSLLARHATGQKLSVYTTLVSGPRRAGEVDGPEEFHVVFLDNGRSNALGQEYQEALYCIRCAACLNACPVYRNVGGYAYGGVYSGPIGAVITPIMAGLAEAPELPHASSLCGACWEVCPVGIHLHDHLLRLRAQGVTERRVSRAERLVFRAWARLWSRPWSYRLTARLARWLALPFARAGWLRWAPGPLLGWTRQRDFPLPAARPFRDRWAALARAEVRRDG